MADLCLGTAEVHKEGSRLLKGKNSANKGVNMRMDG
jgi:hypothetical protein